MKFNQPAPQPKAEILAEVASENFERICKALTSAALHEPDRARVEALIIRFLSHEDPFVRGVAALSAGHVARLHGALDTQRITPLIERLLDDPRTRGKASDALDDIHMFLRERGQVHLSD